MLPCMLRNQLMHSTQGVRAVVTLNEDFEVFISTEQYKVCPLMTVSQLSCWRLTPACCIGSSDLFKPAAIPPCPAIACRNRQRTSCRPHEVQHIPGFTFGAAGLHQPRSMP